jgi:hypothetical protein
MITLNGGCPTCAEYSVISADDNYQLNSGSGVVGATMTTIAETGGNNFGTGYEFGTDMISRAYTESNSGGIALPSSSFAYGGAQSWPNDSGRIRVSGIATPGPNSIGYAENDAIDLHH